MIICQDTSPGNQDSCLCLSIDKNEYRSNARYVLAPRYTIDIETGTIIPGQGPHGRARYHRRVKLTLAAVNFVKEIFTGLETPTGYRYLSFANIADRWFERQDRYYGCRLDWFGSFAGDIIIGPFEMSAAHGAELEISDVGLNCLDLPDMTFGQGRIDYISSARSAMTEMISLAVMNGYYTDKQPEIDGSEEADLI